MVFGAWDNSKQRRAPAFKGHILKSKKIHKIITYKIL